MKKLLVFAGLFMLINLTGPDVPTVQAGEYTTFVKGHAGVIANNVEEGDYYGTFKIEGLRQILTPHLFGVVGYQDLNTDVSWNSINGDLCFFGRDPNVEKKVNVYFLVGGSGTYVGGGKGESGYGGGLGVIFPIPNVFTIGLEFKVNQVGTKRFYQLTSVLLAGLKI